MEMGGDPHMRGCFPVEGAHLCMINKNGLRFQKHRNMTEPKQNIFLFLESISIMSS